MTGIAGSPTYDAVVLAGGAGKRLGGIDKPAQRLGGRMLLDRVLDAVGTADRIVVVGPARATARPVSWTREESPGAGPLPALAAGLAEVRAPFVVALAADLPFLRAEVIERLLAAVTSPAGGSDPAGAVLVDDGGARQWLAGAWRTGSLRSALAGSSGTDGSGSLRAVMAPLAPVPVRAVDLDGPPPWYDCDTPEEFSWARAEAER